MKHLIGAIYLDQGFNVVENFILKTWKIHISSSIITFVDSKTRLQEYSLKKFKVLPIYKLLDNSGPKHKPVFKVGVRLKNTKRFTMGLVIQKKMHNKMQQHYY